MPVLRAKDLPYPDEEFRTLNDAWEYCKKLRTSLQEDQVEKADDFDQLKLSNVPYVDVRTYGLIAGDNASAVMTKNVAGWNTLIAAVDAGTEIYFPKGIWYINSELDVTQEVTIRGDGVGSEIQQEVDQKRAFNIFHTSNVTIRDLRLYGNGAPAQGDAAKSDSDAIQILGTAGDPPTNLVNVKVIGCFIENWGEYGIYSEYLDNFEFSGNYIKTIKYAGIMGICIQDGIINNNRIDDIKGIPNTNAYGISLTKHTGNGLTEYPRSARIAIVNNIVTNVLTWDAISTHGAEDCFFNNNIARSTMRGINAVEAGTYAPINNTISNNIIDIGSITPGTTPGGGCGIAGYDASNLGTGCIIGNTVIGYGPEDNILSGALGITFTQGVVISGNRIINASPRGIMLYHDNYDFVVTGNTILDVWSESYNVIAISCQSDNNIGYIGENNWANVTKSSDYYLGSGDSSGIYIANQAGNAISLGNNHSEDADTEIHDVYKKAVGCVLTSKGLFIGDSVNTKMTRGITINQGTADDEILALKSSNVSHGCIDYAETDTYAAFLKDTGAVGGLLERGLTKGIVAINHQGLYTTSNTSKNTTGLAPFLMDGFKISGTGIGNAGAEDNIFVVRTFRGGSAVTLFIVDEDGDILYDGTSNPYQDHDDIELLAELEVQLDKSKKLKSNNKYKKKDLKDLGILKPFLSTKGLNMLLMGSVRQLNDKIEALEAR